ncbi:RNI-like superfamily protein [Artemisia annua]|uniref:RNI-like superfamily protein n=1 Tax=Artemisia annua TaxID=35608 RepID=A0A2U1KRY0_ARTAN|nr:RNI-like superfamily protein [Artemisia annua]
MPRGRKSKQERADKQKRDWLKLPSDVTRNILYKVGVIDILENAQKVCTAWRKICKDPSMWRVIYMTNFWDPNARPPLQDMCKHAVDRSQGQLVDLTIVDFGNDDLLLYVADRASNLRRLEAAWCYEDIYNDWSVALKKFAVLEELSLYETGISEEAIETAGRYCPMLRTLKVNQRAITYSGEECEDMAIAIGKNLPELRHLELIGDSMSDIGLKAILDGCRHLESLDLRDCLNIDLKGDIVKRCSQQIKYLKVSNDSHEPYVYEVDSRIRYTPPTCSFVFVLYGCSCSEDGC